MKTTTPDFIRYYLAPLLHAIDSYIARVDYICEDGNESVRVVWLNGTGRQVNVTGDSLATLSRDVLRRMC